MGHLTKPPQPGTGHPSSLAPVQGFSLVVLSSRSGHTQGFSNLAELGTNSRLVQVGLNLPGRVTTLSSEPGMSEDRAMVVSLSSSACAPALRGAAQPCRRVPDLPEGDAVDQVQIVGLHIALRTRERAELQGRALDPIGAHDRVVEVIELSQHLVPVLSAGIWGTCGSAYTHAASPHIRSTMCPVTYFMTVIYGRAPQHGQLGRPTTLDRPA